ncbi:hypothetical protein TraAM80_10272, partial [Trypanosoma rangeli]
GAWGGGYCTESDWRDLRAVARDMTEAEIEGQYCSRKPEFVQGLRAIPQMEGASDNTEISGVTRGSVTGSENGQTQKSAEDPTNAASGSLSPASTVPGAAARTPSAPTVSEGKRSSTETSTDQRDEKSVSGSVGTAQTGPQQLEQQPNSQPEEGVGGTAADAGETLPATTPSSSVEGQHAPSPPQENTPETKTVTPSVESSSKQEETNPQPKNTHAPSADSAAPPPPLPHAASGGSNAGGQAEQPAANAATKTTKVMHGDSDGGTAASHCTSPLALLLLACAAAAAMAAA